jgi:hypothetical protein
MGASQTVPGTFVIESNRFDDEDEQRQEGQVPQEMRKLTRRPALYRYIRTRVELAAVLKQFRDSRFRYLHLACHGTGSGVALTLENIQFASLANLLVPHLNDRRLFVSACNSVRHVLAAPIFRKSSCHSVIGPRGDITFSKAAISWASFHSVMSKEPVKRAEIIERLDGVCRVFRVRFNAFFPEGGESKLVVLG